MDNSRCVILVPAARYIEPHCELALRQLEGMGYPVRRLFGYSQVDRALAFIERTQDRRGCWIGRWGVNYIYGTWQAIVGLAAVGVAPDDPAIQRAANWLVAHQQPSGGWGESPDSYAQPHLRGQGPVTASQTAWALMGLVAAGRAQTPAATRGVAHLVRTQREDGAWHETEFTGTGFPRVFYLRYHYYPIYFPLLALAQWFAAREEPAFELVCRAVAGRLSTNGAAPHA